MIADHIAVEQWATVRLPPNATNKQTARDSRGLVPEVFDICHFFSTAKTINTLFLLTICEYFPSQCTISYLFKFLL